MNLIEIMPRVEEFKTSPLPDELKLWSFILNSVLTCLSIYLLGKIEMIITHKNIYLLGKSGLSSLVSNYALE